MSEMLREANLPRVCEKGMVRSANSKVAVVATALVVVAALVSHAAAFDSTVYGMDVSDPVDQATFQCLKADNLTFVVIRVSVRLWPMAMSLLAMLSHPLSLPRAPVGHTFHRPSLQSCNFMFLRHIHSVAVALCLRGGVPWSKGQLKLRPVFVTAINLVFGQPHQPHVPTPCIPPDHSVLSLHWIRGHERCTHRSSGMGGRTGSRRWVTGLAPACFFPFSLWHFSPVPSVPGTACPTSPKCLPSFRPTSPSDVYMFPCYSCGDGEKQVETAVSYLQQNKVKFGVFWLDIEVSGGTYGHGTSVRA